MCKNTIQFQKGIGILQFLSDFGSEEQCENALASWRWPEGFKCRNVAAAITAGFAAKLNSSATVAVTRHL